MQFLLSGTIKVSKNKSHNRNIVVGDGCWRRNTILVTILYGIYWWPVLICRIEIFLFLTNVGAICYQHFNCHRHNVTKITSFFKSLTILTLFSLYLDKVMNISRNFFYTRWDENGCWNARRYFYIIYPRILLFLSSVISSEWWASILI